MLKQKKHNTNAEWKRAFDLSDKIISREKIESRLEFAALRLKKQLDGRKPVCCWSGGKDAQVVKIVYEKAGFDNFVLGCCPELEYPEFLKWLQENKPTNTTIYEYTPDYEYMNNHPDLIFPKDSKSTYWYYTHVNQQAWYKYCKEHKANTLILGHRELDGNQCGKDGVMTKGDILKISPIYDFTHEEVFATIKHFNLPLPPIYGWENGFIEGTHTITARSGKNGKDKAMDIIHKIDSNVLPELSKKFSIIKEYCLKRGLI